MATTELIDISKIAQPFTIDQALVYMRENGEYIRYHSNGYDFYMCINHEQKPVVIDGKRQLKTFEKIVGVSEYGNTVSSIPLTDLLDAKCYIQQFTESGEPIWTLPEETTAE